MLNKLYSIMDFLAAKFNLFKVETIGDAYVCCSGLPQADENHAQNVANFAIASVLHKKEYSKVLALASRVLL